MGSFLRQIATAQPRASSGHNTTRALGYPYPRPSSSFVFDVDSGTAFPFTCASWAGFEMLSSLRVNAGQKSLADALPNATLSCKEPLTPVLAIGSNAAPSQLARKFTLQHCPPGSVIPTLMGTLQNFDCVYAPLVSSYGSVTATLEPSEGTELQVFVTFFTSALLRRMHETEGAYSFYRLENIHLELAGGHLKAQDALCYIHQAGTLCLGGGPVALKEIHATKRLFPAATQQEMQQMVRDELMGGDRISTFDAWVQSNLNDDALRCARVEKLIKLARPFRYQHAVALQQLGDVHSRNVK